MQVDVNILIPVGTFVVCMMWLSVVVFVEYFGSAGQSK